MKERLMYLALGGLLVAGGFWLGQNSNTQAQGQTLVPQMTQQNNPVLISSSQEGDRLHIWTFGFGEHLDPNLEPEHAKTIEAR